MCTQSTELLRSLSEAQSASVKITSSPGYSWQSNFHAQHRRPTMYLRQCFIMARCFRCGFATADINRPANCKSGRSKGRARFPRCWRTPSPPAHRGILAIADVRTGRLAPRTHSARALLLLETMLQEDGPRVFPVRMPLEALLGPCQLPIQELHGRCSR